MDHSTTRKNKKVIFYAPIGNLTKGYRSGGAEAGCRKTIEVLTKAGHTVELLEKPAKKTNSIYHKIILLLKLVALWLKFNRMIIKDRAVILHVAGFYIDQIYFEWLMVRTAAFWGVSSVYEIRNGGMDRDYYEGSNTYKWFMKDTLSRATLDLCQGYNYVIFIKEHLNKPSVYYPNYIMDQFITSNDNGRENAGKMKLIYFGRVVADKNVEFIIDVCSKLRDYKLDFSLDIIGSSQEDYEQILKKKIQGLNFTDEEIILRGRMDFDGLYKYLKQSHFFIFPSLERREGHSNSLTEAMGCGVVPIVSTAGLNENVVKNETLVMREFAPSIYADRIAGIWNSGQWKQISDEVYNTVINNYTESIVKLTLLDAYASLQ